MKKYLTMLLMSATISGCTSEAPVSVELNYNAYSGTPQLIITSTVDEVEVKSVQINRGNCIISNPYKALPYKLKFGEFVRIGAPGCPDVLEAYISTSEGNFDFNFKN